MIEIKENEFAYFDLWFNGKKIASCYSPEPLRQLSKEEILRLATSEKILRAAA
jgi:hypothetical protein